MGKIREAVFSIFLIGCFLIVPGTFAALSDVAEVPEASFLGFTLYDIRGEEVTLSRVKEDSPLLLIFWAMWSEASQDILQQLNQSRAQYENHGIKVLTINVDRNPRNLSRFILDRKYQFSILKDPKGIFEDRYEIYFLPTNILIDRNNVIVYRDQQLPEVDILAAALH